MAKDACGWVLALAATIAASCSLPLDPAAPAPTVARFDPDASVIPLPTDILLDHETGRLDLPIEEDMTPAEQAFRGFINEGYGWSTTFPASVEFSGPVDRQSITAHSLQIWHWGDQPARIDWAWHDEPVDAHFEGPLVELREEETELSIEPPRFGWPAGGQVVMLVRGGGLGVHDLAGRPVDIDAPFFFLRLSEPLDTYDNQRAFPGATRAERLDTARQLEEIRVDLDPLFRFFEGADLPAEQRIPREEVVALWSFTATTDAELAMDERSQRIPIPFELLIDPDTGLVDVDPAPWDTELEADAKRQLNRLAGFGVSANLMFELTEAVDPATATPANIKLLRLGASPAEIPI
ncbi:MAG: hypothetical protein JRI23_03325 [Deltaproteobacteria bacterium]|jgi:hypothetical protein|nr:hypothetical protein [Deltaproteobacteria bacterium]MBW2530541.1 hypothetical protein [Deltaproteobacteria bacterium]